MPSPRGRVLVGGCPHCGGGVSLRDAYPTCINCGWEDYNNPIEDDRPQRNNDTAQITLRYTGNLERWKTTTILATPRGGGKPGFSLDCPFCGANIPRGRPQAPSRKRKVVARYSYYGCEKGHAVHVLETKDGYTWR